LPSAPRTYACAAPPFSAETARVPRERVAGEPEGGLHGLPPLCSAASSVGRLSCEADDTRASPERASKGELCCMMNALARCMPLWEGDAWPRRRGAAARDSVMGWGPLWGGGKLAWALRARCRLRARVGFPALARGSMAVCVASGRPKPGLRPKPTKPTTPRNPPRGPSLGTRAPPRPLDATGGGGHPGEVARLVPTFGFINFSEFLICLPCRPPPPLQSSQGVLSCSAA
jgi:hypothetical protein